ncbi:hypothetical protein ABG067_005258 [Albugo candida]
MLQGVFIHTERHGALLAHYFDFSVPLQARNQLDVFLELWWNCSKQESDGKDEAIMCNQSYVLIRCLGELRVTLVGTGEYDEFVLYDVMNLLCALLMTHLKKLTESAFVENYAAVVVLLDEIVQCNHWESTELGPPSTRT